MIKINSTQVSRDGISGPRAFRGKDVISAAKNNQMARLKYPQHVPMSTCTVSLATVVIILLVVSRSAFDGDSDH